MSGFVLHTYVERMYYLFLTKVDIKAACDFPFFMKSDAILLFLGDVFKELFEVACSNAA